MQVKRLFITITVLFCLLLPNLVHAQRQERPIVKLIYFLPRNRPPQPDIDAKIDKLIKNAQEFYAKQMDAHGFGRKTFKFETDVHGNVVVHHIKGKYDDTYYHKMSGIAWEEIKTQIDWSKNIYLTVLDISTGRIGLRENGGTVCGVGTEIGSTGGAALIPASSNCFDNYITAAHELGHCFGLRHDTTRSDGNWIQNQEFGDYMLSSYCAAEWLDVHPAFNPRRTVSDAPPTVEMLPSSFVRSRNAIRFRFKVSDPDGLHQVQLLTPPSPGLSADVISYKSTSGTSTTLEFIPTVLFPRKTTLFIAVIDVNGNFARPGRFPIDIPSLLPPSKTVLIPDTNLAAAVRGEINGPITTHTILNLRYLEIPNSEITDLTGLEHARNLKYLNLGPVSLGAQRIERNELFNSNKISDFSPLATLTNLTRLYLSNNNISDVSVLAGLKQLEILSLTINAVSDLSPLSGLTGLRHLHLSDNSISDIAALAGLKELKHLHLSGNSISDTTPLANLTQLKVLHLSHNTITDVSPLIGLDLTGTQHRRTGLYLSGNPLSYLSIRTHIPAMQAKGIIIAFDNRAHPILLKISGDNQAGEAGAILENPIVVEAQNEKGEPMLGAEITFTVVTGGGSQGGIVAPIITTDANGRAQTTLTLGPTLGTNKVTVTGRGLPEVSFTATATIPSNPVVDADVNGDGVVDDQDIDAVSAQFGQQGENDADVNGDGVVNIADLLLVAGVIGGDGGAPALYPKLLSNFSVTDIQQWLNEAKRLEYTDTAYLRGIAVLEHILTLLLPKETALLTNYPNPFNPETWIPYQLAKPGDVTLTIYAVDGQVVRRLALGHQAAGMYHSKSRAAYWDGRNEQRERVASGIYFYTLTTDDFTATRKMLIRK